MAEVFVGVDQIEIVIKVVQPSNPKTVGYRREADKQDHDPDQVSATDPESPFPKQVAKQKRQQNRPRKGGPGQSPVGRVIEIENISNYLVQCKPAQETQKDNSHAARLYEAGLFPAEEMIKLAETGDDHGWDQKQGVAQRRIVKRHQP